MKYSIEEMNLKREEVQKKNLQYQEISQTIIGCAFEVINELGIGFLESVYEKAMLIALIEAGLSARSQCPIIINFRNQDVGNYYADIVVEDKIIVELKAVRSILPEHQAQIINYLNGTGIEVGLLINFGTPTLEFKRFSRSK